MILAGDLGGTKVALGLFEPQGAALRLVRQATFASRKYRRFDDILSEFLGDMARGPLRGACFAVAGPVIEGHVHTTNLPWTLDAVALAQEIGVPRCALLNDLEATAYGVLQLPPADLAVLNHGSGHGRAGTMAVIAAGTGLGEAILFWDGRSHRAIPSEGGHVDFAPRSGAEIGLWRHLRELHGHVSYERVLSGPGLFAIYCYLRDCEGMAEPAWLTAEIAQGDPSAAIAAAALSKRDRSCVAAVETFCSIYGAEAGNLALKCLAVEVAVAGGIAPKMLTALQDGNFMAAFTEKGRFKDHLRGVAVTVVLNPEAALLGAAHCALRG